jgi:outer membrane protein assembly factor BamB
LAGPTDLVPLPNGDLLVACSGSSQHLLDRAFAGTGALMRVRGDGIVESFVVSPEIAVPTSLAADDGGSIYVGQRNSNRILRLVDGHPVEVYAETDLKEGAMRLAVAPDGTLYAASPFDGRILQVEPRRVAVEDEYLGRVGGLAFTEKGELLATSFDRGELRGYDARTGELLRILAHDLPAPWAVVP